MLNEEQLKEAQKEACKIAKFFIKKFLMAGRAYTNGKSIDDFDKNELEMGIAIEMEHTKSPMLAARISIDHLTEIPDYYTRLTKMESDAKKELEH